MGNSDWAAEHLVHFDAGEDIVSEGDEGHEMFIIEEGEVEILRTTARAEHSLAVLGEGDFFGEMALLENLPRVATARAVTHCTLLKVDASLFDRMVRHQPEILVRMLRKLSGRLRRVLTAALAVDGSTEPAPAVPLSEEAGRLPPCRLVDESTGTVFEAAIGRDSHIGRFDSTTGFRPEIELGAVDSRRSVSRRHARLYTRGGAYWLEEEIGVANGTFVNGRALTAGVPVTLNHGDRVELGAVTMVFRCGDDQPSSPPPC